VRTVRIQTASARYSVFVQPGLLATLAPRLRRLCGPHARVFAVTSPPIWELWRQQFLASFERDQVQVIPLFVPPGERYKRLSTVEHLAEQMVRAGARRDDLLLAFGGGVLGDMTGFLAAIYMRGIPYVQIPTTYLAQIDSSVGGKTGVNLRVGKNLLGSFHHPAAVFCDPSLLLTLPPRELRAGLVESVKAAVLGDRRYFGWLERNMDKLLAGHLSSLTQAIQTSVQIKARIVGADERESGQRMLLNLGHTVGHAIESVTHYRGLLHGEAVAWGMLAAARLAVSRQALTALQAERIQRLTLHLGPFPRFRASARVLLRQTASDKKHLQHARRFILPTAIGQAMVVEDVTQPELLAAIQWMLRLVRERGA
jgi:3-dehydroquinate synthase